MSDKLLVVYNTCEITHMNVWWYIDCIKNLLRQDYDNFQVVVSGCKITGASKAALQKTFGDKVWYSYVEDVVPVNVTFNHTVNAVTKKKGPFDGYIYVDSGMNTQNQTNVLQEINARSSTRQFGMVTVQPSTDTGYEMWFGKPEIGFAFTGEDFIVPVGKACPLHFQCFDHRLLEYYGRLIPDIFKTFCTESTFSFLNAALGLKWVFIKDLVVSHNKASDGPCGLVNHQYYGAKETWNNLLGGLDIKDLIMTPEGKRLGMGYEEAQGVFMHDPACYDENGFVKNAELKAFIKKNLFVTPDVVDYEKLTHTLII
jgi:hypothetical protein